MCWNDSQPNAILCGSIVNSTILLDVETDHILYQCKDDTVPLNGLAFTSGSHKFFTLSNNGSLKLWDPRIKVLAMHYNKDLAVNYIDMINYAMDVCGSSREDTMLTCVSKLETEATFYELRQWKKPFASISLAHYPEAHNNNKHLCVKVCSV